MPADLAKSNQRAFRQRKESYIKKLEEQVRDAGVFQAMQQDYERVQQENSLLRDYIASLQLRLLETQGEYPPPHHGIDLRDPRIGDQIQHSSNMQAPTATMGPNAVSHLQAAAAAAQAGELGNAASPYAEGSRHSGYPERQTKEESKRA